MPFASSRTILVACAALPFFLAFAQQQEAKQEPTCEQVFKNIQVFKGSPASDLIPSMEFMAAALKRECSDCHNPQDYAEDTPGKGVARRMILMMRDINTKNFGGRTQVTCMTCHRGSDRPVGIAAPDGVSLRHERIDSAAKPDDLFSKHLAAIGKPAGALVRFGTLTAPNDVTHKPETKPVEFIQSENGKFRIVAGDRKIVSDGKQTWYDGQEMSGEGVAIFGRIGRTWRTQDDFSGIERPSVAGKDTLGKMSVVVVRGNRPATSSTEELYFDPKAGLLVRLVNLRRSSLGTTVSTMDYSNYKTVAGVRAPMKVVATFAGGEQWIAEFKSAKVDPSVKDSVFTPGR